MMYMYQFQQSILCSGTLKGRKHHRQLAFGNSLFMAPTVSPMKIKDSFPPKRKISAVTKRKQASKDGSKLSVEASQGDVHCYCFLSYRADSEVLRASSRPRRPPFAAFGSQKNHGAERGL